MSKRAVPIGALLGAVLLLAAACSGETTARVATPAQAPEEEPEQAPQEQAPQEEVTTTTLATATTLPVITPPSTTLKTITTASPGVNKKSYAYFAQKFERQENGSEPHQEKISFYPHSVEHYRAFVQALKDREQQGDEPLLRYEVSLKVYAHQEELDRHKAQQEAVYKFSDEKPPLHIKDKLEAKFGHGIQISAGVDYDIPGVGTYFFACSERYMEGGGTHDKYFYSRNEESGLVFGAGRGSYRETLNHDGSYSTAGYYNSSGQAISYSVGDQIRETGTIPDECSIEPGANLNTLPLNVDAETFIHP